jgi:uncharacterized membrane protein
MTAFFLLRLLHILFAAVWFGGGLFLPGDIRRTIALGPPHAEQLVARIDRVVPFLIGAALLTLLTGGAMVLWVGGFSAIPRRIQVGLLLTVVIFLIGAVVASPQWKRIAAIVRAGGDLAEAKGLARRFSLANGIEHLLWLVVLALMVLKIG